jgi:hypothetical protein
MSNKSAFPSEFCWTTEHQLKEIAPIETVLAYPNVQDHFVLDTDVSESSIGAVLLQIQDGCEKPIDFASTTLTPTQRKYCVTEREEIDRERTRKGRGMMIWQEIERGG